MPRSYLVEERFNPFGKGAGTTNGVQYSTLVTTSTDLYEAVETVTITLPLYAIVEEFLYGLTAATQSSSTTESVLFKWQASDDNSNWDDLCAEQTQAASAAVLADATISGNAPLSSGTNFKFASNVAYVRFVIKSGAAGGETAKGKTKNNSWITVKYRMPWWK